MVQGRLLTAHPEGVHGEGGALRGDSSLRKGAGTASPGSPDLETAAAAEQRGDWEKDLYFQGFLNGGEYIREGRQPGGHQRSRHPPGAPQPWAMPPGHLGPWWVPSFPLLVIPEASWTQIFYIIFPEFLGHFKYWENLKYKNNRKQELALGCTELIG